MFDEDILKKNDFIGQAIVPLKSILVTNNRKMQKILEPNSEVVEPEQRRLLFYKLVYAHF